MTHGSLNGYIHHRCRCVLCRAGNAAYQRIYRERHRAELRAYNREYMQRFRKYGPKAAA